MIIDAHYHLEERMVPLDTLLDEMDRAGVERVALIAALQDPFVTPGVARTFGGLMRVMLSGGLHRAGLGLYSLLMTKRGEFNRLGKKYLVYELPDNEKVGRALRTHPDRFYGWITVNPRVSDACAEAERWAGQPGWIGVKSHPFWHRYPVALLDDVAGFCSERKLPLLIHLGANADQRDFRHLPERHPRLKIVYAHAGVPAYGALWAYAQDKPNIYVDLSNSLYVGKRERLGAIAMLGARRCLFGTDGPYMGEDVGQAASAVRDLPLSAQEKANVLGDNFLELMG